MDLFCDTSARFCLLFRVLNRRHPACAAVQVLTKHGQDPRQYEVLSEEFIADEEGHVAGLRIKSVQWTKSDDGRWSMNTIEGTERVIPADCVLLALGFVGPEREVLGDVSVELDPRANFKATEKSFMTSEKGLFAAGDCRRGQSLVVWAIAEGRAAAASIHRYLIPSSALE